MLKRPIIFTSSNVRDFSNVSIQLLEDNYMSSFTLKNIDDSSYKFGLNNDGFDIRQSGVLFNKNITNSDQSFDLKIQKRIVTEITTNLKINDTYESLFGGLVNLRSGVFFNCNFLGNISDVNDSVSRLELTGSGEESMDLNEVPEAITQLRISGDFEINTYTRRSWLNGIKLLVLENEKGNGLTQQEVDNLLEDLSQTSLGFPCTIRIIGNNSSPSATGIGFLNSLVSQGAVVQTN